MNDCDMLTFIMRYMDAHVDERGVRQPPHRHLITHRGAGYWLEKLRRKGYLRFQGRETIVPTPKAEVWWSKTKKGENPEVD